MLKGNEREFSIVTPSFGPDLDRCTLLCRSIDKFAPDVDHYLIIDQKEVALFEPLRTSRRKIILSEKMLPGWLLKVPYSRRWWFSFRSPPVRGWIRQQILKLSVSNYIDSDVYMFMDSDVILIKPIPVERYFRNGSVKLYRVPDSGKGSRHLKWHKNAGRLLGLQPKSYYGSDYIGHMITWRRDVLKKLQYHMSEHSGKHWQLSLARTLHFSEYILYGIFAEHVLGKNSGHFHDKTDLCHCSWHYQIDSENDLESFLDDLTAEHIAVLVQSNHGLDVNAYRDILKNRKLID